MPSRPAHWTTPAVAAARFLFTVRPIRFLAMIVILIPAWTGVAAAQSEKLVIAIDAFENPANYRSSTIGNALMDLFITSLARTGKFTIMDTRRGIPVEVDVTFSAKVTNFSYREEALENASAGERLRSSGKYRQTMNVRLDMTVVDQAQEIIFAEAVEHHETNTSTESMTADYERMMSSSASVTEIPGSMMGRVTEVAVDRAVERVMTYFDILGTDFIKGAVEGRIIGVMDAKTAIMDQGRAAGLRTEDTLEVLRDNSITNAAGEVVFTRQTSIGTARVGEVQESAAMVVVTTTVDIVEGDVVRRAAPTFSSSEHIDKGTAFLDAGFYAAALREFSGARDGAPESLEPLYFLGLAYLKTNDSAAALESFAHFLDAGAPIEWDAKHLHRLGNCRGKVTLTNTSIGYRSPEKTDRDHWFDVSLVALEEARLRFDVLLIRAKSAKGKTKNWTFQFNLLDENEQITDIILRYITMRRQ